MIDAITIVKITLTWYQLVGLFSKKRIKKMLNCYTDAIESPSTLSDICKI